MSSKKRQSQLFVTLNGKDREERMGTNWSLKAGERVGKGGQTTRLETIPCWKPLGYVAIDRNPEVFWKVIMQSICNSWKMTM